MIGMYRNFRCRLLDFSFSLKKTREGLTLRSLILGLIPGIFLTLAILVLEILVMLISLPFFILKNPRESFYLLTRRDQSGNCLDSYYQRLIYRKISIVVSTLALIIIIIQISLATVFTFFPFGTKAVSTSITIKPTWDRTGNINIPDPGDCNIGPATYSCDDDSDTATNLSADYVGGCDELHYQSSRFAMKFDLSSIPNDATITNVEFRIHITTADSTNKVIFRASSDSPDLWSCSNQSNGLYGNLGTAAATYYTGTISGAGAYTNWIDLDSTPGSTAISDIQARLTQNDLLALGLKIQTLGTNETNTFTATNSTTNKPELRISYTTPPTAPTGFGHSGNATTTIGWQWTDAATTETRYDVHDGSHSNVTGCTNLAAGSTSCTETGLSANTQYTRHANVTDPEGNSDSSNAPAYTSIENPTGATFNNASTSTLTAAGAGTISNLASGSSGIYFRESVTGTNSGWITTNSWAKSSLSANTQYSFYITTKNGDGEQNSEQGPFTKYTAIESPSGITFDTVAATSLTVSATGSFSNLTSGSSGIYLAESVTSTNSGWVQTNTWQKTGLTANTQYSFTAKARNGDSDETSTTGASTKYTLAADANVSSSPEISTWTKNAITFTNNAGWNGGGVQYYRYVLDQSTTHSWTDTETQWTSGTKQLTPDSAANSWYLHVKAYNGDDVAASSGATQDLGPYYYDATAPSPNPSTGSATADSATQITWTIDTTTDANSGLAALPYSFDNGSTWQAGTTYQRTGLTANTQYTQNLKTKDAAGNETTAGVVSAYTLPSAPNVSASRSASTWSNDSSLVFTNEAGFGAGAIQYYRYAWDQNATHTFTDSETQWSSGTLSQTATLAGSWYLHVKAFNNGDVGNGTGTTYGPYYYDATVPTITNNQSGDDTWRSANNGTYNVDFTDATAGISYFQILAIANNIIVQDWTTVVSSINASSYTTNWSIPDAVWSNLVSGTNYISVKVFDQAGNSTTQNTVFYIKKGTAPDTTAPVISQISSSVTTTTATITWTTDESATSQVEYGLTSSYGTQTTEDTTLATSHSVTISSLTAGTTYHFRVHSKDAASNEGISSDQTLTTSSLEATIISNALVTKLSPTSVKVTWTTNHAATTKVRYGLTSSYGSEYQDTTLVTSHEAILTGLNSNTTYHYEVMSQGNTYAFDADATFTTLNPSAEVVIGQEEIKTEDTTEVAKPTTTPATDTRLTDSTPTFSGLTEAGATITLYIYSSSGLLTKTTTADSQGYWSYTLATALAEGTHTVYIKSVKADGTTLISLKVGAFQIIPPAPTVTYPDNNEILYEPKPLIMGLARSASTIKIYLDGHYDGQTKTTTHSSGVGSFTYRPFLPLKSGSHTLHLYSQLAGTQGYDSQTITFAISQPISTPTLLTPTTKDSTNPRVIIPGLAKNNSSLKVYLDGVPIDQFKVTNHPSGTANFSYQLSANQGLSVGHHTVFMIAYDQAGRTSNPSKEISFEKGEATKEVEKARLTAPFSYLIVESDSLWKIAERFYGDGNLYPRLVETNKAKYPSLVTKPGIIVVGWTLTVNH